MLSLFSPHFCNIPQQYAWNSRAPMPHAKPGEFPHWIDKSKKQFDVSYHNFTILDNLKGIWLRI